MSYPDSLRGIATVILASLIALYGLIGGISYYAGNTYGDEVAFPVTLRRKNVVMPTAPYGVAEQVQRSVWLKVPDRQIENKDFQILVRIIDRQGETLAEMEENFRMGYLRSSAGDQQYYRLDGVEFPAGFSGYLQYVTSGEWEAPYDGTLVLRYRRKSTHPFKYGLVLAVGVMILMIGLRQIPQGTQ